MAKPVLLIIDDEQDIRALCSCIVKRSFDFEIVEAGSLQETNEVLKTIVPDYVILDLHLKDGVGFDLMPAIHKVNAKAKVLIVTAYNHCDEKRKSIDLGAFGLLGKPFESEELVERINEIIQ
ncbi:MAG: response regulator [Brumimicrobium sp.]